jgi:hypothetical protein
LLHELEFNERINARTRRKNLTRTRQELSKN